jgi:hypothetical protein
MNETVGVLQEIVEAKASASREEETEPLSEESTAPHTLQLR